MMELYIHIPFCVRKCRYCDFASFPGMAPDDMEEYVGLLLSEAGEQASALGSPVISTVFIGGGTPSILPADLFEKLLSGIQKQFRISPDVEWSVEANPGTLTEKWLQVASAYGVNRLSLGMQAVQPSLLQALGRIHTAEDVVNSVALARSCGFDNISLDLMFGLPGQTEKMWLETIDAALSMKPKHLSCYGLIPEAGTPLKDDLDQGIILLPDEEIERQMYDDAIARLHHAGFQQYEISNFSLPGYACRHNIGYWKQDYYLGLGVSAASMLPSVGGAYIRKSNPSTIRAYRSMLQDGNGAETQLISREEAMFESLMLGLRMTEGIDENAFFDMHGVTLQDYRGKALHRQEEKGFIEHTHGAYRLTRRGMDIQNSILVDLMDP